MRKRTDKEKYKQGEIIKKKKHNQLEKDKERK